MPLLPSGFDPVQTMTRPDYELRYKRDRDLENVELHHHDFYEIYYLVSGDVTYTIEGSLYRVLPGDVLILCPRELHKVRIRPEHAGYERYVLWITPAAVAALGEEGTDLLAGLDPAAAGFSRRLRLGAEERERLRGLLDTLAREETEPRFGGELMRRSLITELMVALNRWEKQGGGAAEEEPVTSRLVSEVIAYIGENFGEPLTLEGLAEHFYVSKYHLSHEFNRQTGTGVYRYIQKKRLIIARELMAEGVRPSEVYSLCGFGDYTAFYRAYRAEYGTSPRGAVRKETT